MSYALVVTNIGLTKLQNAVIEGGALQLVTFAVGDGVLTPAPTTTQLVSEKYRTSINAVEIVNGVVTFNCVVPEEVGGWYIREVGVFDIDGDLFAVANTPITYKTLPTEGAAKNVHLVLKESIQNSNAISLTIDQTVVYSTQYWVNEKIALERAARESADAALQNAKQDVIVDGGLSVLKINIDGATDIGAALVDADTIIVGDVASGNRKSTISRVWTYIVSKLASVTNIGVGIAARAWQSNYSSIDQPAMSSFSSIDGVVHRYVQNAYVDINGIWRFVATGKAQKVEYTDGSMSKATATGNAGELVTWRTDMIQDNSGNLTLPQGFAAGGGISFRDGYAPDVNIGVYAKNFNGEAIDGVGVAAYDGFEVRTGPNMPRRMLVDINGNVVFYEQLTVPILNGTLNGKTVVKSNAYADAAIHSGLRGDSATGNSWIFVDDYGSSDAAWGVLHNQENNSFDFYGAGILRARINLADGVVTASTFQGALTGTASSASYLAGNVAGSTCTDLFYNTPVHSTSFKEALRDATYFIDAPLVGHWFIFSMRHSNAGSNWGTQMAYGWEGNANRIFQRNVSAGAWSAWVEMISSNNLGSSAVTTTGDQTIGGLKNFTNQRTAFGNQLWDVVGVNGQAQLLLNGYARMWVGAGNGTWYTGAANTSSQETGLPAGGYAHDTLITSDTSDGTYYRGITYAVATNDTANAGYRVGKWYSGTTRANSRLTIDGGLFVKGGYTDSYDFFDQDYAGKRLLQGAGGAAWRPSEWDVPSAVYETAMQIQAGNASNVGRMPQLQFHQYGYGGGLIRYNGVTQSIEVTTNGTASNLTNFYVHARLKNMDATTLAEYTARKYSDSIYLTESIANFQYLLIEGMHWTGTQYSSSIYDTRLITAPAIAGDKYLTITGHTNISWYAVMRVVSVTEFVITTENNSWITRVVGFGKKGGTY